MPLPSPGRSPTFFLQLLPVVSFLLIILPISSSGWVPVSLEELGENSKFLVVQVEVYLKHIL